MKEFSTSDLAQVLGKSNRFVIDQVEKGLFLADLQSGGRSGVYRVYSYPAVLRSGLAIFLTHNFGIRRNIAKVMLDALWERQIFHLIAHKPELDITLCIGFRGEQPDMEIVTWYSFSKLNNLNLKDIPEIKHLIALNFSTIKAEIDSRIRAL